MRWLHALKAACGGDEGFFREHVMPWCLQYGGNAAEIVEAKWESIKGSSIGADFVFRHARDHGFSGGVHDFDDVPLPPDGRKLTDDEEIEIRRATSKPVDLSEREDRLIDQTIAALVHSGQNVFTSGSDLVVPIDATRKIWGGTEVRVTRMAIVNDAQLAYFLSKGV